MAGAPDSPDDRAVIGRARAYLRATVATCGRGAVLRLQALQLLGAACEAAVLALLIPVIEVIAGADDVSLPVVGVEVSRAGALAVVAVAVLLRAAVRWLTAVATIDIRIRTTDALRLQALEGVLAADWGYVSRQRRSDVVQATTAEIERAEAALVILLKLGVDVLLAAGAAVVAIAISPLVGGLAVLSLVLVAAVGRGSVRRSVGLGEEWSRRTVLFGATVTDSLASLRLIRAHDAAAAWSALLRDAAARGRATQQRFVEITAGISAGLGLAGMAGALALVLVGRAVGLETAALLALAVVTVRLLTSALTLLETAQLFAHYAPALDAVQGLIADTAQHREARERAGSRDGREATSSTDGADGRGATSSTDGAAPFVELCGVTAGYGEVPALVDLDLRLPATGLVAVTGPSGSGKSTLLDVLLGLLEPDAGTLLVDGRPLEGLPAWRRRLGYVPQENLLVPGTVRENLTWSALGEPPDEELWAALEDACAADVVRRLPDRLDTALGDSARLSGGEQQRLSLARALVRRPQLLVLDEATSALDTATERAVVDRLVARPGLTVIATHRAAVIERADQVVMLRGD